MTRVKAAVHQLILATCIAMTLGATASAHVTVQPKQTTPATFQTFTVSVPNERDVPVTTIRLSVPSTIRFVTPTVKSGWQIATQKQGDTITEITWSDGSIAKDLRDEFTFTAQTPAQTSELRWKAYQTYQDGVTVSWDQSPSSKHDHASANNAGPYSVTDVTEPASTNTVEKSSVLSQLTLLVAGAALLMSVFAVYLTVKRR